MTKPDLEPAGLPEESGPRGFVRLRLDVAYDGSAFCGWARQPGLRSVQGVLEAALRVVLRLDEATPVRGAVAGRTDAGVHALGQVCHADVPGTAWLGGAEAPHAPHSEVAPHAPHPLVDQSISLRRRLNGVLPPDIRVRHVGLAAPGFDARWSAAWRRYTYLVADDPSGQEPRTRGHVLWHPKPLDVDSMDAAAVAFLGEHDFAAYCRARRGASSVRTIHEIGWRRLAAGAAPCGDGPGHAGGSRATPVAACPAEFTVRADAFCHSMVRSLVGAFLAVGEGRWPAERPAELLAAGQRVPSITTAPAHPLTLVEVGYPPDADLAAQAEQAKRWRGR